MAPQSAPRTAITDRIRGEFNEMPGLCLTFKQAQRLWALDGTTCARALEDLLAQGFLRRTFDGQFLRVTSSPNRNAA
jgi:hypothetical protein